VPPVEKREFWSDYQPGFRFAGSPVGTREFFDEVTAYRDAIEPHIPEVVDFPRWSGSKVLEAGCGIGTDGVRFARAGAEYTGFDFSPTALSLARHRFEMEGLDGRFVSGSVTQLPLREETFDLVFSHGVIHHVDDTEATLREFERVLKPGGTALVMVYHRRSLNYHVSIMLLRRALVGLLLLPKGGRLVAKATGEPEDVIAGHKELLSRHGFGYIRDRALFLNHNTDGPGNPLAKVYSRVELAAMAPPGLEVVRTEVRYLNLRLYPGGPRFAATGAGRRLERRLGWHLYLEGRKLPSGRAPLASSAWPRSR
jgi:ubiquinone/menaquinone biosynthesis C-methylase UbiE